MVTRMSRKLIEEIAQGCRSAKAASSGWSGSRHPIIASKQAPVHRVRFDHPLVTGIDNVRTVPDHELVTQPFSEMTNPKSLEYPPPRSRQELTGTEP